VAGAFLLLPFLMHGAGGGDVKMLFAAGTMVGWSRVIYLLWYMSLAGLVLAVVMVLFGWADGARLKHYARCLVDWRYDRKIGAAVLPPKESDRTRMPFSIAISVGLLMALMVKT
jgi:Flp pilus assembly protein protease CpaA